MSMFFDYYLLLKKAVMIFLHYRLYRRFRRIPQLTLFSYYLFLNIEPDFITLHIE